MKALNILCLMTLPVILFPLKANSQNIKLPERICAGKSSITIRKACKKNETIVSPESLNTVFNVESTACVPGPKGEKGPSGNKGQSGKEGQSGEKGNKGDSGVQGARGPQGPNGRNGISPFDTIPSGITVGGALNYSASFSGCGSGPSDLMYSFAFPAIVPTALQDSDIIIVKGNAVNASCGSSANRLRPPGKVCVYISTNISNTISGKAFGKYTAALVFARGFVSSPFIQGGWNYTAP